ncbi:hypothetical protein J2Z83_003544 [Virgibacillus natechei]|uniref:Uncharacterized protein n=1 Tax=Virgibacillus natechei TaxID=1216297 RepID=A0ABS4ILH6_9BACI|nr:hypothetical protein [Virgibacillus natechei]MBP1971405.1 hypothetical protein [Virgibacillus natechei]UZD12227.1 hypothetical protein OLD84_15010 [Virgibacillus natechei]
MSAAFQELHPIHYIYINLGSIEPLLKDSEPPKKQLQHDKMKGGNNALTLPEVVFDEVTGKYLVVGGYTSFYTYHTTYHANTLIPCKISYSLTENERYLVTIDWLIENNAHDLYT